MDSALVLTAISGATVLTGAIVTAGLTYLLTKRRETGADWRKLKLEQYKEYVTALSGIVEGRDTPAGQFRYADAVNSLTLVASPHVLRALYAYMDHTRSRDIEKSIERHDKILTNLLNAMRQDVFPHRQHGDASQTFRLITVPPDMRTSRSSSQVK